MKLLKKTIKLLFYLLMIPLVYFIVALILTFSTIERELELNNYDHEVFLNTNGIHLDIIIPIKDINRDLLRGIKRKLNERYISFGWGDENFYINTPTWDDLTMSNACKAMFMNSSTLMHITRYQESKNSWSRIEISDQELQKLNDYLLESFKLDENGKKVILEGKGYHSNDDFYKANGSYSCLNTCNSWVNSALKKSGMKSCRWTPFDFGLLDLYTE